MSEGFAFDLGVWFADHHTQVRRDLKRYFGGKPGDRFSGRWFEKFAATGEPNRFEPLDVLAVEALSVNVPPETAATLFMTEADRVNGLLEQIPPKSDLWQEDRSVVDLSSAAYDLHAALYDLWKVGWVTAGKLMAAKRPRLIPILDKEVKPVLKPPKGRFWVTMYDQLVDDSRRQTIADVCTCAPDTVSLLRRIDVALWMHAVREERRH
jgi:Family of unknown function (DUF6308)